MLGEICAFKLYIMYAVYALQRASQTRVHEILVFNLGAPELIRSGRWWLRVEEQIYYNPQVSFSTDNNHNKKTTKHHQS